MTAPSNESFSIGPRLSLNPNSLPSFAALVPMSHNSAKGKEPCRSPCYILSIPDDVLFEIMTFLDLPESMDRKMSITLTSVCRKWRSFVLDTPLFWTNIKNPFALYPEALNPFERSYPALVDVLLDTKSTYIQVPALKRVCDAFAVHLPRFRRLTVDVYASDDAKEIFRQWAHHDLPCLETLVIRVPELRENMEGSSLLPSNVTLRSLRSLTLRGPEKFDLRFFPEAPSLERLDIFMAPETLQAFGVIFNKFPLLQVLIVRDDTFGMPDLDDGDSDSDMSDFLDEINDSEQARVFPARKLHSLAISLSRITKPLTGMEGIVQNLEYVEIAHDNRFPRALLDQRAVIYQWKMLPNLKKFRLHLAHSALWDDDKFPFFLPKGIDLEIDHPPLGSETTLMNILNSKTLKTITIALAPQQSWGQSRCMDCNVFSSNVCAMKPILCCPTTLLLPENEELDPTAIQILGAYLTIGKFENNSFKGLIETFTWFQTADFDGDTVDVFHFAADDDDTSDLEGFSDGQYDYEPDSDPYDSDFNEYGNL